MPEAPLDRARYRRILRFAARHVLITWWYEVVLPFFGLRRVADRTRTARLQEFARRFRILAVELGGLMIKMGQFMSTRLDVLPPEITKELEDLQDEVPPVPFEDVRALAERDLGMSLARAYAHVEPEAIAAASLGQAYRARLSDRDAAEVGFADVVLKVQRPGIEAVVAVDLAALRQVASWMSRVRLVSNRVDLPALVEEFARASREEVDYLHEASNATRFAENFADDARVRTPAVVWERTTRRVLTLEDVTAIKITDTAALQEHGIAPKAVADAFASVMFAQLFEHGFFHADPHPGNLFVTPASDGSWTLTFIDFGMMGEVPDRLRASLRKLLIASAARDGRAMVTAMDDAGVLLESADRRELERAVSKVFARFGGMGLAELREVDPHELRDFALEFSDLMLEMPFQLPEHFLLIVRAVSLTSGLCTSLNPRYNAWDSVEPYAATLLKDEGGQVVKQIGREAVEAAGIAWRLPRRLDSILEQAEEGRLAVTLPFLEGVVERAEHSVRRLLSALVFAALLVAGAMIRGNWTGLSNLLMLASLVPLAHVIFGRRKGR